jgi:hypothetical protein
MLQWLQRRLASSCLPLLVIGCTEIQTGRAMETGDIALHEHWVFVGRTRGKSWAIAKAEFLNKWIALLSAVYGVSIPIENSKSATRVESIRSSVGAYLGKYMSKSQFVVERIVEDGKMDCLPSSWVTRSKAMLEMFRSSIRTLYGKQALSWFDACSGDEGTLSRWKRNIYVVGRDGVDMWIALVGYFNSVGLSLFSQST